MNEQILFEFNKLLHSKMWKPMIMTSCYNRNSSAEKLFSYDVIEVINNRDSKLNMRHSAARDNLSKNKNSG